ncbi:MAG: hypothetical protein HY394_02570 [Candidatus Diapherotrites archaeon]|nr:hypothetical protein [Candidatus Diapherotrites archaeon]
MGRFKSFARRPKNTWNNTPSKRQKKITKTELFVVLLAIGVISVFLGLAGIFGWGGFKTDFVSSLLSLLLGLFLLSIPTVSFFKGLMADMERIDKWANLWVYKRKTPIDSEVLEILGILKKFESDRIFQNERELSFVLETLLKASKPHWQVEPEVPLEHGEKIDMVINRRIGIEVKIAKNNNVLRNLMAQIEEYTNFYPDLIVAILDVGESADLNYYSGKYVEKGAHPIILKGRWTKKDKQYILKV